MKSSPQTDNTARLLQTLRNLGYDELYRFQVDQAASTPTARPLWQVRLFSDAIYTHILLIYADGGCRLFLHTGEPVDEQICALQALETIKIAAEARAEADWHERIERIQEDDRGWVECQFRGAQGEPQ